MSNRTDGIYLVKVRDAADIFRIVEFLGRDAVISIHDITDVPYNKLREFLQKKGKGCRQGGFGLLDELHRRCRGRHTRGIPDRASRLCAAAALRTAGDAGS